MLISCALLSVGLRYDIGKHPSEAEGEDWCFAKAKLLADSIYELAPVRPQVKTGLTREACKDVP